LSQTDTAGDRDALIRVLVADGHPVVREGLKALLNAQPDMRVVGEAADVPAAVALALDLDPDAVVADIHRLPRHDLDGCHVDALVRAGRPGWYSC
jgi:DNA-binding NarL/FixJ family response regulator